MRQAATGDQVRVHYAGTLADGTEFDNTAQREPMELTIGDGQVLPGFENAIVGMTEGETKSVTLEASGAFGTHDPELVHVVERARIPSEVDLQVGTALQAQDADETQINLVVVELNDEKVTLDANHPLAGHALTFQLTLVDVVG